MKVHITAHGGREDHSKIAGLKIKRIAPAIVRIAPRDFGVADTCRVCIHRAAIVVDLDLPGRTARFVHAGDRSFATLGFSTDRGSGSADRHCKDCHSQWPSKNQRSHHVCPLFSHRAIFLVIEATLWPQGSEKPVRLTGIEIAIVQSFARVPSAHKGHFWGKAHGTRSVTTMARYRR